MRPVRLAMIISLGCPAWKDRERCCRSPHRPPTPRSIKARFYAAAMPSRWSRSTRKGPLL